MLRLRRRDSRLDALIEATAGVERADPELAEELRDVRSDQSRRADDGAGARLESLGVEQDASASLTRESIVLRRGRPVLDVVNDVAKLDFRDVESEIWRARLSEASEALSRAARSVGRIEVENHRYDWVGTGWLVAPDLVVTNRHVANEFAKRDGEGFVFRRGFGGSMSASVDFLEEVGSTEQRSFAVSEIVHLEDEDGPDVAFLRLAPSGVDELGPPIVLAARTPRPGEHVAVIGYPARDSRIPEYDLMLQIFGNVFDKKRLAPGQVKGIDRGLLLHDCSTLGGTSGSVVLDLRSGEAMALHFSGRFLDANYAVPAQTVKTILESIGDPSRASVFVSRTETSDAGNARSRPRRGALGSRLSSTSADDRPAEAVAEGRIEDYDDREGYVVGFLGTDVALPDVHDDGDVLTFRIDGKKERELRYEHFSVLMSKSRRLCHFSAVNIDGRNSTKGKRPAWRLDPRIPREQQIVDECYGNAPRFARGHMTRREDPIWGSAPSAARGNTDSMHVTNAVPQMQPFNAGVWLGLEDYALDNAREDDMRIVVFTGPVFREDDPVRYGVQVPLTFWKVIAFIHDETREPCVTGYTMSQEDFLREEEFVFGRHETAQVPLSVIEQIARVSFSEELRRLDPLQHVAVSESRARPLGGFEEIRFR